jgi:hypothetical protein
VLGLESENIRRALAYLTRSDRVDDAAELVWSVWIHWLTGHMLEGRKTMAELLGSAKPVDRSRARLLTVDGVLAALLGDPAAARDELGEALEYLHTHEDLEARAAALTGIGLACGVPKFVSHLQIGSFRGRRRGFFAPDTPEPTEAEDSRDRGEALSRRCFLQLFHQRLNADRAPGQCCPAARAPPAG